MFKRSLYLCYHAMIYSLKGTGAAISRTFMVVGFFIISTTLFPLTISPDSVILPTIATSVIWICGLLSMVMSLSQILSPQPHQGELVTLALCDLTLYQVGWIKVAVHWISSALPLIIATPFLSLMFHLSQSDTIILILSQLLATPTLSLWGIALCALSMGSKSHDLILSLIFLPLCIPLIIFSTLMVQSHMQGGTIEPYLYILGAFLFISIALAPFCIQYALKLALEESF